MSLYNRQHMDAILMVRNHLAGISPAVRDRLEGDIEHYLEFREEVACFHGRYFADICSAKCFSSRTSACCGREGILVFFADVVVNALRAPEREIDALLTVLRGDGGGFNCVYLSEAGCLWRCKPIACEMFLCGPAREKVFEGRDSLEQEWDELRRREWLYTRPTQQVLFDGLESVFIEAGLDSPLMFLHKSPGLLRLKAKHGL